MRIEGPAASRENAEGGPRIASEAHHGGELTGAAEQCQQDRAQIRPAILPHAGDGGGRNRAAAGSQITRSAAKGQAMGGGEASGDMGFHVDGERAALPLPAPAYPLAS